VLLGGTGRAASIILMSLRSKTALKFFLPEYCQRLHQRCSAAWAELLLLFLCRFAPKNAGFFVTGAKAQHTKRSYGTDKSVP
jgi:hypothetical protein